MAERPGHQIRTANSVAMVVRRLADVERAERPDAMELIGLWDELARIDRKWREQTAAGSERRSEADEPKLAGWFERLSRQIERALRDRSHPAAEQTALHAARKACADRQPMR